MAKIRGAQTVKNRFKKAKNVKSRVQKVLLAAGQVIADDARESIIAGSVSGPGHIPSRPGEPPNADTHQLDMSIDVELNPSGLTATVIARAPYSAALEFGTSRMSPRPFLRPALQRNRNRLLMGMASAVSGDGVRVFKSDGAFANAAAKFEG